MAEKTKIYAAAIAVIVIVAVWLLSGPAEASCGVSSRSRITNTSFDQLLALDVCGRLGLPQARDAIPLPDSAFTRDRSTTTNYMVGTMTLDPPIFLALPRPFSDRIDPKTGEFKFIGNSDQTFDRAVSGNPGDGIFIDVGGFIGDSSFPSAILGFDTYVFEPVRANTNLMHISMFLNDCALSEHLTIVNTLVSDTDGMGSIFVSEKPDNSAATKALAQLVVGAHNNDHEESVGVVKLDSFFPAGTRVQNLKIDVQGNELHVLKGAERLLRENQGRLKLRFECHANLLKVAGTSEKEIVSFMEGLGYTVVSKNEGDIDME